MQRFSRSPVRSSKSYREPHHDSAIPTPRDTERSNKRGTGTPLTSFRSRLFGYDDHNQSRSLALGPEVRRLGRDRETHPFTPYNAAGADHDRTGFQPHRPFRSAFKHGRLSDRKVHLNESREEVSRTPTDINPAKCEASPLLQLLLKPQHSGTIYSSRGEKRPIRGNKSGDIVNDIGHNYHKVTQPLREAAARPQAVEVPRQPPASNAKSIEELKDRYGELSAALQADVSAALDDSHATLAERVSVLSAKQGDFLNRYADLTIDFGQPLSESYVYEEREGDAPDEKIFVGDVVAELQEHLVETEKRLAEEWERWDECKAAEERAAASLIQDLKARPDLHGRLDCEVKKWEKEMQRLGKRAADKMTQLEKVRGLIPTVRSGTLTVFTPKSLERERNDAIRRSAASFELELRQFR
ncbi:predicted protein [Verticillium alfalfae VaMs.102]|uniref:Predicted protein n=1 Tax=Verticillium alfalfae (strain VaMs.102 / ATCC MYA-4576 / FGSC 10136) TaxID=526221 RepID=C9SB47_VERA1|nr:predicted protein [Verticillium alfalfae VaMs.102]EEY15597.1 predicted protein [Verticillium alfalfae VaMs.102]